MLLRIMDRNAISGDFIAIDSYFHDSDDIIFKTSRTDRTEKSKQLEALSK